MEITRRQIFTNVIWRFLERIGAQLVSFVVSIVIARLLDPSVYGVVALVTVFISILQVFVDSGLGNALIQKKDADDIDFSTVFFTNITFCIIIYALIYVCAPYIAKFYKNDDLSLIIRVLGIVILISGVKNVQQAYVAKHLLFRVFFLSTLVGTILAAIIGILMAIKGYGIWALVTQQLVNVFVDTVIVWIVVKWRPKLLFSFKRLSSLYSFGWKLLLTSLINTVYNKLREVFIGKLYTPADLAFFNRGNSLSSLVVMNVDTAISSVIMPTLANYQDDRTQIKKIVKRSMKVSSFVVFPCLLGMATVAPNLINVLLSEKWMQCVPFLQIFCIGYMFYPIYTANLNVYNALGRSDLFLKVEIIKKIIGLVLLLLSLKYGVLAIAISFLIERVIELFIDIYPNKKLINYSLIEQFKDLLPIAFISVVMSVLVFFIGKLSINIYLLLFIQIISGFVIYCFLNYITKNESFYYLLNLLRSKFTRKTENEKEA